MTYPTIGSCLLQSASLSGGQRLILKQKSYNFRTKELESCVY